MSVRGSGREFAADEAVSNIVGTVLILAITVAAFGGLSLTVMDQVARDDGPPRTDLQIQEGSEGFLLHHRGGDSIPESALRFVVYTTAGTISCKMSQVTGNGPTGTWTIGESLPGSDIYAPASAERIVGIEVIYHSGASAIIGRAGAENSPGEAPGQCVNGDLDGDGVANNHPDLCPNTPPGSSVDADGCTAAQRDPDGDGVDMTIDHCPDTPPGETVNANGCSDAQLDPDNDNVLVPNDLCPGTPPGATVDQYGCSAAQRDADRDGVPIPTDKCPDTAPGVKVKSDGCAANQGDGICTASNLRAQFNIAYNGLKVNTNAGPSADWDCPLEFEWQWRTGSAWTAKTTNPVAFRDYTAEGAGTYQITLRVSYAGGPTPQTITKSITIAPGSGTGGACMTSNSVCGDDGDLAVDVTEPITNCYGAAGCSTSDVGYVVTEPDQGLVIPPGHPTVEDAGGSNSGVFFQAPKDVILGTGVEVNGQGSDIRIISTTGDVHIRGAKLTTTANGKIHVEATVGSIFAASVESPDPVLTRLAAARITLVAGQNIDLTKARLGAPQIDLTMPASNTLTQTGAYLCRGLDNQLQDCGTGNTQKPHEGSSGATYYANRSGPSGAPTGALAKGTWTGTP